MTLRPILRELAFHWPFLLAAWLYAAAMTPADAQVQCYIDAYGNRICPQQDAQGWSGQRLVHPVQSAPPDSGYCQIHVGDGSLGSGALIAKDDEIGEVLTCSHLFDQSTANIIVEFPDGKQWFAKIVDRDRGSDLALLKIRTPTQAPIPLASSQPGGTLRACGFGGNQGLRCASGRITGSAMAAGASSPSLKMFAAVRPGDSGGPVLNEAGEVAGVIWGVRDGETYFTGGVALMQFCQGSCRNYNYSQPTRRVVITPSQPRPTPTQPAFDADKLKTDILVEVTGLIEAARCQCDHTECMTLRMTENLIAEAIANIEAKPINYQELANNIDVNQVVQQLDVTKIAQAIAENLPKPPTEEQLTDAVVARLQPINIRVQDARGPEYSTQYQEIRVGTQKQYVTLPFGPRN
jgi:hypothetical protein